MMQLVTRQPPAPWYHNKSWHYTPLSFDTTSCHYRDLARVDIRPPLMNAIYELGFARPSKIQEVQQS